MKESLYLSRYTCLFTCTFFTLRTIRTEPIVFISLSSDQLLASVLLSNRVFYKSALLLSKYLMQYYNYYSN